MPKHTAGPWTQGTTLSTSITRRWTDDEWQANQRRELCLVYSGFSGIDAGRGRLLVAQCVRPEDARLIAAAPDLLAILMAIQEKGWADFDDVEGMSIRRRALAAVQSALPAVSQPASRAQTAEVVS